MVNRSSNAIHPIRGMVPLVLPMLLAVLPAVIEGQTHLSFTITDSLTALPVEGAVIELTTPDGSPIWRGRSGSDGVAGASVAPGQIIVAARMIAYGPAGPVTITVPRQDSMFVRILLSPAPLS